MFLCDFRMPMCLDVYVYLLHPLNANDSIKDHKHEWIGISSFLFQSSRFISISLSVCVEEQQTNKQFDTITTTTTSQKKKTTRFKKILTGYEPTLNACYNSSTLNMNKYMYMNIWHEKNQQQRIYEICIPTIKCTFAEWPERIMDDDTERHTFTPSFSFQCRIGYSISCSNRPTIHP